MDGLTPKEKKVAESYLKKLKVPKRKTRHQVAIGMVGAIGSGRAAVAAALAREIGGVLIVADDIRVLLRKAKCGYGHIREIAWAVMKNVAERDGNVVLDTDHVDPEKRNRLKKATKDAHMHLYFVRTLADYDTVVGRLVTASYTKSDLFGGASTAWKGKFKGNVIALREMSRRLPHHYTWMQDDGGKWMGKTMPYVFAEIDTTDSKKWKSKIKDIARQVAHRT